MNAHQWSRMRGKMDHVSFTVRVSEMVREKKHNTNQNSLP